MAENFFLDNHDLQFHLDKLDLGEVLELKEKGYSYSKEYPTAPRNYADAKDNYRLLLEVLGDICANVIAPRAAEADEEGARFENGEVRYAQATQVAIEALRQAELNGAMLPWQYGGLNLPETVYQMMVEMVSRAEGGLMTIFGLQEIASTINEFGDEELKQRVLPRFCRGEVNGAMILTEADAGSDLGAVQTKATYDEETGQWYLNGVKRFITNGCADISLVLARTEEGSADARGLSMFFVEKDETVHIRRIEHKLGIRTSPTCEIQYDNTPAILIGKRRFGLIRYAMALMNGARLAVSAQALGIAEAAYREAYDYAYERAQFKTPIKNIPAVSRMLLSMRGEIEAARTLIYETGRWVDLLKAYDHAAEEGKLDQEAKARQKQAANLADALTPLAKYYATEMGNRVAYQAMQIHGGVGYMKEFNVERHYRDVRVTNIYEGTSQLQIVAAIGKLLGHALDELLDNYAGQEYGPELASLKAQLVDANEQFKRATDHLKEHDREVVDYYASDLADMGIYLVNSWLLLQAARASGRKKALTQVYLAEHLPQIHRIAETIQTANAMPLEVREAILAQPF
ncbi:MAG: acyl-CoA dehydrogenase family protein [Anaerolineae bacterium]|nr:acyl-CoA dehydrogenase family protein [Anaerolineae bacterium]